MTTVTRTSKTRHHVFRCFLHIVNIKLTWMDFLCLPGIEPSAIWKHHGGYLLMKWWFSDHDRTCLSWTRRNVKSWCGIYCSFSIWFHHISLVFILVGVVAWWTGINMAFLRHYMEAWQLQLWGFYDSVEECWREQSIWYSMSYQITIGWLYCVALYSIKSYQITYIKS